MLANRFSEVDCNTSIFTDIKQKNTKDTGNKKIGHKSHGSAGLKKLNVTPIPHNYGNNLKRQHGLS